MSAPQSHIVARISGSAGRITLDRPKALNSLTSGMVHDMARALDLFERDARVHHVIVDGGGGRAFCAGGDVRLMREAIATDPKQARDFWRDEYRLNLKIANYPKPYVAVMDGICMGGGVGISAHGTHRIVTERSQVAMPETLIGFIPDVGGSWLLARAPGHAGEYMAALAYRMNAADAIYAGFADHHVPSDKISTLIDALCGSADAGKTIAQFASDTGPAKLEADRAWIDAVFCEPTIQEAVRLLEANHDDWSKATLGALAGHSPTALAAAHRAVQDARDDFDLAQSLAREFRYAFRTITLHDFGEGVRARVIDKDNQPRWRPPSLDQVRESDIDALFASLGPEEWHP
jgi:enoyl-CoA hydratase